MQCPLCRTLDTGRVGNNQYYCWQCLLEFKQSSQQARIFYVEEDGTLVPVSFSPETS
jgi:ribosomal protein L37AE/L43A